MAGSQPELNAVLLLRGYAAGVFPMAETRDDDEVFWVDPKRRGVLPLDRFHISRSLRKRILSGTYSVTFDKAFGRVVAACADRTETWINDRIEALYGELHALGHAHSTEVWEEDMLVGGVYGVALGGAYFGESMFSYRRDASKVALAYLVDRLTIGGFKLFDTQFLTDHLASLGAIEVSRAEYHRMLAEALNARGSYHLQGPVPRPQDVVQRNSQMS